MTKKILNSAPSLWLRKSVKQLSSSASSLFKKEALQVILKLALHYFLMEMLGVYRNEAKCNGIL